MSTEREILITLSFKLNNRHIYDEAAFILHDSLNIFKFKSFTWILDSDILYLEESLILFSKISTFRLEFNEYSKRQVAFGIIISSIKLLKLNYKPNTNNPDELDDLSQLEYTKIQELE